MATTVARARSAGSFGRRSIIRAQRYQAPVTTSSTGPLAFNCARWRRLSTLRPTKPSSDGSSVSDAAMVRTTVNDADTATPYRNDSPRANWPSRAMHTVIPAKNTARPAVLTAFTVASSTLCPPLMALR